jgi:hypothetical protein
MANLALQLNKPRDIPPYAPHTKNEEILHTIARKQKDM